MMNNKPSNRLVKHIIRSYARLAENVVVRDILKANIPPIMREKSFLADLDDSSKKWLTNLMKILREDRNNGLNNQNSNMGGVNNINIKFPPINYNQKNLISNIK